MKRSIKPRIALIALIVVLIIAGSFYVQTHYLSASLPNVPKPSSYDFKMARSIATASLPKYMDAIGRNYAGSGFNNEAEKESATLGEPYMSYGFDLVLMSRDDYQHGNFRDQLYGGSSIEFPVLVHGEPRSNISVIYADGTLHEGSWGGYQPTQFVNLQRQLAKQGITERVDLIWFGVGWTQFGMIEYQGQTILIPLYDPAGMFPTLDFTSNRMYPLDEILPVIHEQAKIVVTQSKAQDLRMWEEWIRTLPQLRISIPTPEPIPPTAIVAPITTNTPEPNLEPGQTPSTELVITLTPVP